MKKTLLCIGYFFFFALSIRAQEVVGSQGESFSNTSGKIQFTAGETVIATHDNGSRGITQGFHQTKLIVSGIEDFAPEWKVLVYPNPVMHELTVRIPKVDVGTQLSIVDMNGKIVKTLPLNQSENRIDVSSLTTGGYLILIIDLYGNILKTYKINKLK